jgi:exopolyphosphatase/guanosine-5'-triphosphate,3'-diphosphate pyrophosphatase
MGRAVRQGAIGIGSNSVRLLIADLIDGQVRPLQRLREGTRLFQGLTDGALSEESMMRTAWAVARLCETAKEAGCEALHLIATSAARDALNGAAFCELVEACCGLKLRIISGAEEARLSFLGVAAGGFAGVIDLGGGSLEIAVGGAGRELKAGSAQLGATRLQRECPDLTGDGLEKARALSERRVRNQWALLGAPERPPVWYGVGGTLTCLASLDMAQPYDRAATEGHLLSCESVAAWARRLAALTEAEIATLPGMVPARADIIAHGAAALWGAMDALHMNPIIVSTKTNLDGCLREVAQGVLS